MARRVFLRLTEPGDGTEDSRRANFTNELGVDNRTRFLRNVGGLWLLQECLRAWQRDDLHALGRAGDRCGGLPRARAPASTDEFGQAIVENM